jgi:AcrR family transcriptional regulator
MTAPQRREVIERAASEVFSERGYRAATIDEIARRSGVSAPVVYDHFDSKLDLHRRLLERHFSELRAVWREQLAGDEPAGVRIGRAFDAWFGYVEGHPYAWRMLFRDTTGDPDIEAFHRGVAAESRDALIDLLAREPAAATIAGEGGAVAMEMLWEVVRAALQGLALSSPRR